MDSDDIELEPESVAAAEAAREDDPAGLARQWLLQTHAGTLCTTSCKRGVEGFPFGSVVPFALTPDGRPYILIARIATHTANLRADPRASLFVRQPDMQGDPQAGWRVTLMGTWEQVAADDPSLPELHARYVQRVPTADGYLQTHDFAYWQMTELRKVRFIGGFGKICWLAGHELLRDPAGGGLAAAAPGAVDHMNEDHGHNLVEMLHGHYGVQASRAVMTGLHRDGFFVKAEEPEGLFFFPFGEEIEAGTLRPKVIEVLQQARAALR